MPRLLRTIAAGLVLACALASPAAAQDSGGEEAPEAAAEPSPGNGQVAAGASAAPRRVINTPARRVLVHAGPRGRLLMGGRWHFRLDDANTGVRRRFFARRSLRGWSAVRVPHNWNARDYRLNRASVGWYRTEFRLPRGSREHTARWRLRFESVNHRATVWLNGREVGRHTGGYLPFEVDIRPRRRKANRLVVRVSTLRTRNDLTHWRPARFNGFGTGGWWNFGGLLREVYVRQMNGVDVEDASALPAMRCPGCAARVRVRVRLRNLRRRTRVTLRLVLGRRRVVRVLRRTVPGGRRRTVRTSFVIRRPRLWEPGRPSLYRLTVRASAREGAVAHYRLRFGVRTVQRGAGGAFLLNGRRTRVYGASVHEDDALAGAAWGPGHRRRTLGRLQSLGANATRAHYPLHPALLEAFDRAGILVWSQAPVYQVQNASMDLPAVREAAVRVNRDLVRRDLSHPSVFAWSMANELPAEVSPGQAAFVTTAARAIRRLDPTRLVAIDRRNRPGLPDGHPVFSQLDALGLTEYFGWYHSRDEDLVPFFNEIHRLYPQAALFVTEFGAESNRHGPVDQPGTFEFQTRWMREHLALHDSLPYLNGSIAWILRDFRVNPTWAGGNPAPSPPWNNKGLVDEGGALKPAFFAVQALYRARTR